MARFCGEYINSTDVSRRGPLSNECFLDGLSLMPHIIFVLISVPILIAWNKSQYGNIHAKAWVQFPAHNIRWSLTIVLIILHVLEIGEGSMSNATYEGLHLHLIIPACVALCGAVCSIVYYHHVERWNSPKFLSLLIVYFGFALVTKGIEVAHLFRKGLGVIHVRFDLSWDIVIVYIFMLLIELYVLLKLKYAVFKHHVVLKPPEDMVKTDYVYSYVSLASKVTFIWVRRLLRLGYKRPLEMKDLGKLPPEQQYIQIYDYYTNGYILAILMLVAMFLQYSCLQTHYYLVIREGIRLRGAVQTMVYMKAERLSTWALSSDLLHRGKIINHISVDAGTLMFLCVLFHFTWAMPLQMSVALILLYCQLGVSALIGSVIIVLLSPLQYQVAKWSSAVQKKTLECSDERLKCCNELLQGIKLIKLFAWEDGRGRKVETARTRQLKLLLRGSCLAALTTFITAGTPVLVMLVTFTLYPYFENEPLTAAKAFTGLALFDILNFPLLIFPLLVNTIVNAKVSTDRLGPFLQAPEVEKTASVYPTDEGIKVEFHLSDSRGASLDRDNNPPGGIPDKDSDDWDDETGSPPMAPLLEENEKTDDTENDKVQEDKNQDMNGKGQGQSANSVEEEHKDKGEKDGNDNNAKPKSKRREDKRKASPFLKRDSNLSAGGSEPSTGSDYHTDEGASDKHQNKERHRKVKSRPGSNDDISDKERKRRERSKDTSTDSSSDSAEAGAQPLMGKKTRQHRKKKKVPTATLR